MRAKLRNALSTKKTPALRRSSFRADVANMFRSQYRRTPVPVGRMTPARGRDVRGVCYGPAEMSDGLASPRVVALPGSSGPVFSVEEDIFFRRFAPDCMTHACRCRDADHRS